ncbi:sporulation protein YjcZ [Nanoarchaeota archaeon]
MTKKTIALILVLMIVLVIVGCTGVQKTPTQSDQTAEEDVAEDVNEVDSLSEDLDTSELDELDQDLDDISW